MAHVYAEDLMSYPDYSEWKRMEGDQGRSTSRDVMSRDEINERAKYERISCRAWTDLLLQLLKVPDKITERISTHKITKQTYLSEMHSIM